MSLRRKTKTDIDYARLREKMVEDQLRRRDVRDQLVLAAMGKVERHLFVPHKHRSRAYDDCPQAIGHDQTISQPYIVASMTEHLDIDSDSKVLEIGTGCGYQSAILAEIARKVYTIERIPQLYTTARRNLQQTGYRDIECRFGDGSAGWPEAAPFDGIIVTAAAPRVPEALFDQLAPQGVLVIPLEVGGLHHQDLIKFHRTPQGIVRETLYQVRFVPMRGDVEG